MNGRALILCLIAVAGGGALVPAAAPAAQLLFNGDFEAGVFQGWTAGGENGGVATVAAEASCFSASDSTGLTLNGSFAALLRSNGPADRNSVGTLTSEPFAAGSGISFALLSESIDWIPTSKPVALEVRLLDGAGQLLVSHTLAGMSVVRLKAGCPSEPRNAVFSGHYIDTGAYLGQEVRLQFRQHTNVSGYGFFTLVDDVARYDAGEVALVANRPIAVAGTSPTTGGNVQLDGSGSIHPLGLDMTYRWYIDGETVPVTGQKVSLRDYEPGAYRAVLYVDDGTHVAGDTLMFVVPEKAEETDDGSTDGGTTNGGTTGGGTTNGGTTGGTDDGSAGANGPVAVAGTSLTADGKLQLDGSGSSHPTGAELNFRWYVDGASIPLTGQKVLVDDLAAGSHTAVLYVDDGQLVDTDELSFVVNP
jgi:hypothetical protein